MNCTALKKKLNQALLKGQKSLSIPKEGVSENDIEDIKECGYNVKLVGNNLIITEWHQKLEK